MTRCPAALSTVLVIALLTVTAEAQMTLSGTPNAGRRLFYSAAISSNGLSCAHCHADFDESRRDDDQIRAGHSLQNAAGRETWWGKDPGAADAYPNVAVASIVCVPHYLRNADMLTAQQMLDLQAYLKAITVRSVRAPLAIAPTADHTGEYKGFAPGNRFSGKLVFYAACHTCHPNTHAGIAPAIPRKKERAFYARKIREGDGLGAVLAGVDPNAYDPASGEFMPYFGADRLTDQQISDVIAYLLSLDVPE